MQAKVSWAKGSMDNSTTVISSFVFEDAMSDIYRLSISCHGAFDALLPEAFDLVNFTFGAQSISGMLLSITRHEDIQKNRWDYVLEIRPRLYILALRRSISLYPNVSINNILLDLLAQARLSLNNQELPYENLVSNSLYTTSLKRLEISYAATDLEYLQALLQYGIRFCFEETQAGEQVVFVDDMFKLPQHKASLCFQPDKKEDVGQDAPNIYQCKRQARWQPLHGCAVYYDPLAVSASLANLMQAEQTPNDQKLNYSGNPNIWATPCYSPPGIQAEMNARVDALVHSQDYSYEIFSYYSGLRAGEQVQLEAIEGFIESVILTGIFEHELWRYDSRAIFRSFKESSYSGSYIKRMALPGTLSGVEIQPTQQVNDLGEFKVKFPLRFVTDADNEPWVDCRDLQVTSTAQGGASHSMSSAAEVLIASMNGAPYQWVILGSLDNNERPSKITSTNYRESHISTQGGVNLHLRRQDISNPYSEMNMRMQDSQNNPASINLGTSIPAMAADSNVHGIQEISSGYAKRAIMGNFYDTVGSPDNPVDQLALIINNNSGKTSLNRQTHVSDGGVCSKNYYTSAIGAQNITPSTTADNVNFSDEFKLLIATVYGESVGQGPAAWQAIASVIMNRVKGIEWRRLTTVTAVITQPGAFSAYYDPRIQGPAPLFISVRNFLNKPIGKSPIKLSELIQTVTPIYNKAQAVTTDAIYYYSPKNLITPDYIHKGLILGTVVEVQVKGVSTDDFKFFKRIK